MTKIFHVHKPVLTKASSYFAAAFNGKFRESKTNRLVLSEEHPVIFTIILKSIYKGTLDTSGFPHMAPGEGAVMAGDRPFYVSLYISLDKYQLQSFEPTLTGWWRWLPSSVFSDHLSDELMHYTYGHTLPGAALRKLLLGALVEVVFVNPEKIDEFNNSLMAFPEIGMELARGVAERAKPAAKRQRRR